MSSCPQYRVERDSSPVIQSWVDHHTLARGIASAMLSAPPLEVVLTHGLLPPLRSDPRFHLRVNCNLIPPLEIILSQILIPKNTSMLNLEWGSQLPICSHSLAGMLWIVRWVADGWVPKAWEACHTPSPVSQSPPLEMRCRPSPPSSRICCVRYGRWP